MTKMDNNKLLVIMTHLLFGVVGVGTYAYYPEYSIVANFLIGFLLLWNMIQIYKRTEEL